MQESLGKKNSNQSSSSDLFFQHDSSKSFALGNFFHSADGNPALQSNANVKKQMNEQTFSVMHTTSNKHNLKDNKYFEQFSTQGWFIYWHSLFVSDLQANSGSNVPRYKLLNYMNNMNIHTCAV